MLLLLFLCDQCYKEKVLKKVLVTGATGFIGSNFIQNYSNTKVVVRGDNKRFTPDSFHIDSFDSRTDWTNAFDGVDGIVHLGGLAHAKTFSESDYQRVNVEGTLNLATQAAKAGVSRFIFVSSIGVNGPHTFNSPFNPCDPSKPVNDYSRSKYQAEQGLKAIAKKTSLELVIIRPTLVYGKNAPGNFGALVKLIDRLPVLPFGLANNKRSFISVQNLVDILIACVNNPNASGHTFLASDLETVSIKAFTNEIGRGLGKRVVQVPIPVSLMRFVGRITGKSVVIEQLYGDLEVDSSNLIEVLGWVPPFTMQDSMNSLND